MGRPAGQKNILETGQRDESLTVIDNRNGKVRPRKVRCERLALSRSIDLQGAHQGQFHQCDCFQTDEGGCWSSRTRRERYPDLRT